MRDRFAPTLNWLRRCWKRVDVEAVENAFKIRYERPDLPDNITGERAVREFHVNAARKWIGDQRFRIP